MRRATGGCAGLIIGLLLLWAIVAFVTWDTAWFAPSTFEDDERFITLIGFMLFGGMGAVACAALPDY